MITSKEVTGAWYSDCDLQGNTSSLFRDSHITLNNQRIELPLVIEKSGEAKGVKENVLFLTQFEGRFLAGQGNQSDFTWFYDNLKGKWINLGSSFGTYPCYFNTNRVLFFVYGPNQIKAYDLTF